MPKKIPVNKMPSDCVSVFFEDRRGVYIPKNWMESIATDYWQPVSEEDKEILLSGPEHEHYWDTWVEILDNQFITDEDDNKWELYQDGDLFLVCWDRMSNEQFKEFTGEDRE